MYSSPFFEIHVIIFLVNALFFISFKMLFQYSYVFFSMSCQFGNRHLKTMDSYGHHLSLKCSMIWISLRFHDSSMLLILDQVCHLILPSSASCSTSDILWLWRWQTGIPASATSLGLSYCSHLLHRIPSTLIWKRLYPL